MTKLGDRVVTLGIVFAAIGFWSYCTDGRSDRAEQSVAAASSSSDDPVVAVLDVTRVFKEHTAFVQDANALHNDIQRVSGELQAARMTADLSPEDFELIAAGKQQEFKEAERAVYANTYKRMKKAVDLYAKQAGIKVVVRFSSGDGDLTDRADLIRTINRPIVYQDELDITDEIIQAMNFAGDAVHSAP